jgi:hypothetical protein
VNIICVNPIRMWIYLQVVCSLFSSHKLSQHLSIPTQARPTGLSSKLSLKTEIAIDIEFNNRIWRRIFFWCILTQIHSCALLFVIRDILQWQLASTRYNMTDFGLHWYDVLQSKIWLTTCGQFSEECKPCCGNYQSRLDSGGTRPKKGCGMNGIGSLWSRNVSHKNWLVYRIFWDFWIFFDI